MVIALTAVLIAVASGIYYVESLIPFPLPVGRWGFSNSVVLFYAANFPMKFPLIVAAGKAIIGALLSGRIFSPPFFMGFFGSIAAAIVESALFRLKFGYTGASLAGSAVNNLVQMLVGAFLIKSKYIFSFLPMFLIIGSVSALANAYIAKTFEKVWRELQ